MEKTGVTVSELLRMPLLGQAKVVGGAQGLSRPVRCIDIIEVPDLKGWVKEGVLMLTTAYSIRHDPSRLTDMIRTLAQGGAAGLAIKPARFLNEIPKEALLASEEAGLPLIELPPEIPYTDITQAVMEQVLDRQAVLLRRADEIYRKLTRMVLENSGIQAVQDQVSALLGTSTAVVDYAGCTLVASPVGWDYRTAEHPQEWNIDVDRRSVARLLVDKRELDELEGVAIEQFRLVLALELMRDKIVADTESRLRGNFIDELMTPPGLSRHEAEQRGRQLGMNPAQMWQVVVIEGDLSPDETGLIRLLQQEAASRGVKPHVEFRSNRAILFLPMFASKETTTLEETHVWTSVVKDWMRSKESGLSRCRAGIGRPKWLWDIHEGYSEARSALSISNKLSGGELTDYEEIELYHLLRGTADDVGFKALFERRLGKLKQYDEDHGGDLLRTLFFYLKSRGSLIDTANHLFIHRNSVKYRLERIRDIAGFDLNDPHEQLTLHLCLIAYYLSEQPSE
ncbi:PucR family transcriptional regulator [Saccharibacillus endophyticus]|uniref:PucR family transcriptional regulator n=1 Tax=Saccharibacillus endophyticus TaxID=2060666 RepID=A0ABQ1ZPJ5_9BACL|nr:PucR family transcriptional regulator [Saccharibacillus endophyticus]GGH71575.1 PucR family transcriptional regulator [Saccharibacillus endophyticus]